MHQVRRGSLLSPTHRASQSDYRQHQQYDRESCYAERPKSDTSIVVALEGNMTSVPRCLARYGRKKEEENEYHYASVGVTEVNNRSPNPPTGRWASSFSLSSKANAISCLSLASLSLSDALLSRQLRSRPCPAPTGPFVSNGGS